MEEEKVLLCNLGEKIHLLLTLILYEYERQYTRSAATRVIVKLSFAVSNENILIRCDTSTVHIQIW
jgi:hypothetical protein